MSCQSIPTSHDPLGNSTGAWAINFGEETCGYYVDSSNHYHGFVYGGGPLYNAFSYTTVDDPLGVNGTFVYGISDWTSASTWDPFDSFVGSYLDSSNQPHGFLYSNLTYTTLDDPLGSNGTYVYGIIASAYPSIDNESDIVGSYIDSSNLSHGFWAVRLPGALDYTYTTLDDPFGINGTYAYGINNTYQIVGYYVDSSNHSHGFLYSGGSYTTLDDPLGANGTYAYGINNRGQIVGKYLDSNFVQHGFIYTNGLYVTVDNLNAATGPQQGSWLTGINENGQVAGSYFDGGNNLHGLIGTPVDNPTPPAGTTADMILRHSSGQYAIYNIGNEAILANYLLGWVGTDWEFAGLGRFFDFAPDMSHSSDTSDMLLRNSGTGDFAIYNIGYNKLAGGPMWGVVGLNYQVVGFGDFNQDGLTDMVLRNEGAGYLSGTGAFQVYNIVNGSITTTVSLGTVGLEWQVGAFGNFSSRGESDMILRNSNTGGLQVYDINKNQITGTAFMGTVGLEWQISGVGNFSSIPGESDMIMRNTNTGGLQVYDIANNQITSSAFIGTVGLEWQFAGVASIHAPGASDLVLRNVNTGQFEVYNIANNQLTGAASLGSVGLDWQLGGFGADFPTGSMGSSASTSQLVQAMASLGGGSGATESLNTIPLSAETSQQTFLTTPQHA